MERKGTKAALHQAHESLEERVRERTAELERVNDRLRGEIAELQRELDRIARIDGGAGDFTDRRRLEESLRDSELQFRTLADSTSAAIILSSTGKLRRSSFASSLDPAPSAT